MNSGPIVLSPVSPLVGDDYEFLWLLKKAPGILNKLMVANVTPWPIPFPPTRLVASRFTSFESWGW